MSTASINVKPNSTAAPQLGPRYQAMLDANPYRNQTYEKSGWQNLLSAMGFRTQADAFKENMAVQAAEYDASIAQKAYDESFNSPTAQTARMRAAGLNPDIDPGSISPGEAAQPAQDPSTPMQTTGDDNAANLLGGFANLVMEGFSTAMGLVQNFQGIEANHLRNVLTSLQTEDDFQAFVKSMAPRLAPADSADKALEDGTTETWRDRALMSAKMFAKRNLPRKFRDKFIDSIYEYWNSANGKGELLDLWKSGVKGEKEYAGERSHFYSPDKKVLSTIFKHIGAAQEQIDMLRMQREGQEHSAAISEGELAEEIAENTDGKAIGEARSSEAKASKSASEADYFENEVRRIIKKELHAMVKDLRLEGTWYGEVTAGGIQLLEFLKGFDFL